MTITLSELPGVTPRHKLFSQGLDATMRLVEAVYATAMASSEDGPDAGVYLQITASAAIEMIGVAIVLTTEDDKIIDDLQAAITKGFGAALELGIAAARVKLNSRRKAAQ